MGQGRMAVDWGRPGLVRWWPVSTEGVEVSLGCAMLLQAWGLEQGPRLQKGRHAPPHTHPRSSCLRSPTT